MMTFIASLKKFKSVFECSKNDYFLYAVKDIEKKLSLNHFDKYDRF